MQISQPLFADFQAQKLELGTFSMIFFGVKFLTCLHISLFRSWVYIYSHICYPLCLECLFRYLLLMYQRKSSFKPFGNTLEQVLKELQSLVPMRDIFQKYRLLDLEMIFSSFLVFVREHSNLKTNQIGIGRYMRLQKMLKLN